MSFSNYMENRILDHIFSKGDYPPPTIYVGLHTSDPGETGGGEVANANGYARVPVPTATWSAAAAGVITNTAAVTFPVVTGGNWGLVTYFALYDSGVWGGGNMLISGEISQAYMITEGSEVRFDPGELSITVD